MIEGGDKFGMLTTFKEKHSAVDIPDSIFEAVHDGMQGVVDAGTGMGARVPGIVICGKTGTVENYYHGKQQPNHSFFCAFAPRENPKIAIMCVVENSGRFGGTYAAPIVSLMIEKYLNDTIAANRKALVERMAGINLIPPMMMQKMRAIDSVHQVKEEGKEIMDDLKNNNDTLSPGDNLTDTETGTGKSKNNLPTKETPVRSEIKKEMVAPGKQRQPASNKKDSVKNNM